MIVIILVAVVIFGILMFFGPVEYIRSKTFHNGIKGTYVCTDVIVPFNNKEVKKEVLDVIFLDMECDVFSNGTIDGIFKDYTLKLEFSGDFINFPLPLCASYDVVENPSENLYVKHVEYSMASRDKSIENDCLDFEFVCDGDSFFVIFEKVDD